MYPFEVNNIIETLTVSPLQQFYRAETCLWRLIGGLLYGALTVAVIIYLSMKGQLAIFQILLTRDSLDGLRDRHLLCLNYAVLIKKIGDCWVIGGQQ